MNLGGRGWKQKHEKEAQKFQALVDATTTRPYRTLGTMGRNASLGPQDVCNHPHFLIIYTIRADEHKLEAVGRRQRLHMTRRPGR